jgi:uncharacterized protein
MLNLSLTAVSRGEVRVRGEIATDDPVWNDTGVVLAEPLEVDLAATSVGEGVLARGRMRTKLDRSCRRCLIDVPVAVDDTVDLLYEPLAGEEASELAGEVYPLPDRGDELDLRPALREQLLLRVPEYVVCREGCQGLCPHCGANLNEMTCECVPETGSDSWGALRKIKFD